MSLLKRFLFYGGGFIAGLVLLFFFLGGKRTSCDYGPNSRTLKNIRIKERIFSEDILQVLQNNDLDTSAISYLLKKGSVDFGKSNTKTGSCKSYWIDGQVAEKKLTIRVENCEEKAFIKEILTK